MFEQFSYGMLWKEVVNSFLSKGTVMTDNMVCQVNVNNTAKQVQLELILKIGCLCNGYHFFSFLSCSHRVKKSKNKAGEHTFQDSVSLWYNFIVIWWDTWF